MKKKSALLLPIIYTILFVIVTLITSFTMRYVSVGSLTEGVVWSSYIFSILAISVVFYACYYYFNYNKNIILFVSLLAIYFLVTILTKTVLGGSIYMGLFNISTTIIYGLTGLLLYLAYDRFNKVKIQKELRKQNLQSELALLKNQINPHFLFNTLNNIDSLIKSNPDKASATLVELSDMMRYMIYDTNVEKVSLKQELVYIENYLDLQKMQFPNSKLVNYQVNGDTKGIEIPPMLFIPFIENAFKHCTDKNVDDAIRFSFHISDNKIIFKSENIADKAHLITKDKSSGVGLDIVKRRLEILYPNKHTLDIKEENNVYSIYLELNIK